jgi:hypothetical protein
MTKTNEPLPYYKWLWRDWRADRRVQKLNYVAQGLYRSLLDEQWCEGGLPTSVEDLSDICGCPVEVMQEHWKTLSKFFEETEDGVLVNSKLEKQRTAQDLVRAAKSRGGKASALQKLSKSQHLLTPVEDSFVSVAESHIAEQSRADTEQSIEQDAANSCFKNNGQEYPEDWDEEFMKTDRQIDIMTEQFFGKKAFLRGRNGEDLKRLVLLHKGSAVERAYGEWCEANQDNPDIKDPVAVFLEEADDILGGETPARAVAKDPEVGNLVRELSYRSKGQISFMDKQRVRLAEVLKEFTAAEITTAFDAWFAEQDASDPKNLGYLPNQFAQKADQLCYTARRKKQEAEETKALRDQTAARLQEQAEQERLVRAQQERLVEDFDPLSE